MWKMTPWPWSHSQGWLLDVVGSYWQASPELEYHVQIGSTLRLALEQIFFASLEGTRPPGTPFAACGFHGARARAHASIDCCGGLSWGLSGSAVDVW